MPKKNDVVEIKIDSLEFPNKGIGKFEDYKAVVKTPFPAKPFPQEYARKKTALSKADLWK